MIYRVDKAWLDHWTLPESCHTGHMQSVSSPKILRKFSISGRNRPFRVVLLGQNGVGKSAMTVRFLTQRFIGDYDPLLENVYSCTKCIEGETVVMEILDTAALEENSKLEANIKWADAYVLVYSVTDRCSFNECSRLRVLINSYSKRIRRQGTNDSTTCIPAVLVGNQIDRSRDRMVSSAEGREKANEMNCLGFYEISVREDWDSTSRIFTDIYTHCKRPNRRPASQRLSHPGNQAVALSDVESSNVPLQRRRGALYTIS